jgi:peptide/nickel transport system permease protein
MVFAHRLRWLPGAGMVTPGYHSLADVARHMVLPVGVLAVSGFAHYVRYVRFMVLEVVAQDYVRTARAKGLSRSAVLKRHILPNVAIPLVTVAALSLPFLFTGAAMVEFVFAWPGLGRWIISSTLARDYPAIMAANLLVAALVALANLLADLAYMLLDPRLRVGS